MAEQLSVADRLDIQELVARYNWAIDTHDGEGVAATFVPDGAFEMGARFIQGHDALVAFGSGVHLPPRPATWGNQHWVTNMVLEGDAERVTARSYLARHTVDGEEKGVATIGHYLDQLVKLDGHWRFQHRLFRNWPPEAAT